MQYSWSFVAGHQPIRGLMLAVLAIALVLAPAQGVWAQIHAPCGVVVGERGLVVSDSAPASQAGIEILKQGGNAVDAAVATALALAVTLPEAGNIGGGGFMLVHPGIAAEPVCIDYRETAPGAATERMFALRETHLGHKAVGVPGTVRGLALAHQQFGKLPWHELVAPAARLAHDGFVIEQRLADSLNKLIAESAEFPELTRVFGKNGGTAAWQPGDTLVQPDLATALRLIAEQGPAAFYEGPIAEQLVAEMQTSGGLVSRADLAAYRAIVREPVHGTYRGYDIYGAPPPSSGGIATIEILNLLETFDLKSQGRWSAQTMHLMIESMRRAFYDRARYLGDPAFTQIPPELTSKEYAQQTARQISISQATPSEELAADITLAGEGEDTTHFSVVDGEGMAVANTFTLEQSYGSRVVVRGAGFLLNNQMGDFNWKPGHTDRRGNIGTPPNTIAPGKRMLSSQSPTIVARDGRAVLVTGSPGGRTIINTVACVLVNVLEFKMGLREAIDAPRIHHQWFPDVVRFEGVSRPEFAKMCEGLRALGHAIDPQSYEQGSACTVQVHPQTGRLYGAADPRRGGLAIGY